MNKADKEVLAGIFSRLEGLNTLIENIGSELSTLAEAEREKYDNAAENLQGSEQYQQIEAAADALESAVDACASGNAGEALEALGAIEL